MTAFAKLIAALVLMASLVACAPQRLRPDAASLAAQEQRETALAPLDHWQLNGKLGVSDARGSGSGSLNWAQSGDAFRFELNAPVTGKTWLLTGDARHARLDGLQETAVHGIDAANLLREQLGWRVPIAELVWWVRGLRAPGQAELSLRPDGLPARIHQAGWQVDFLDYDFSQQPALPRKIFAEQGESKVRLVIQRWTLP